MPRISKERREECRTILAGLLEPGDKVFAEVTHVSASGMSRRIDCYIYRGDARNPDARRITSLVGDLLGYGWNDGGMMVQGCGMDMRFHVVYSLGRALWPEGVPCTGHSDGAQRCQSNEHNNGPVPYDANLIHSDGGYALRVG